MKLPVLKPMRCDHACGACCGPVPCSTAELNAIRQYIAKHDIVAQDNGVDTCPFYQRGRCAIYEVRPAMCVVFGHHPALECSRGYNVNDLSSAQVYVAVQPQAKPRLLHELIR